MTEQQQSELQQNVNERMAVIAASMLNSTAGERCDVVATAAANVPLNAALQLSKGNHHIAEEYVRRLVDKGIAEMHRIDMRHGGGALQ